MAKPEIDPDLHGVIDVEDDSFDEVAQDLEELTGSLFGKIKFFMAMWVFRPLIVCTTVPFTIGGSWIGPFVPNAITYFRSLVLSFLTVYLVWTEQLYDAFWAMMGVGVLDMFDGYAAEAMKMLKRKRDKLWGAFLDAIADKLSIFIILPISFALMNIANTPKWILVFLILLTAEILRIEMMLTKLRWQDYLGETKELHWIPKIYFSAQGREFIPRVRSPFAKNIDLTAGQGGKIKMFGEFVFTGGMVVLNGNFYGTIILEGIIGDGFVGWPIMLTAGVLSVIFGRRSIRDKLERRASVSA